MMLMISKTIISYLVTRSVRGALKESIDFCVYYRQRYKIVGCNQCGELWSNNPLVCGDCGSQSFTKYYNEYSNDQSEKKMINYLGAEND